MVGVQLGLDPAIGNQAVQGVDTQQRRRVLDLCQAIAQAGDGQQQAWLSVGDDRQQALLMMAAGGLRRVSRHGDHPGVQATKKRRHVVRAAGEQQHCTIPQRRIRLQGGGDGAGALIQVAVTEYNAVLGRLGKKAQGHLVRGLRGAALKGLDQCAGKFEGVHHGFLPEIGLRENREKECFQRAASGRVAPLRQRARCSSA
ncbi:hypothetical protein PFUM301598_07320 [Pseudomonas fluorescens]